MNRLREIRVVACLFTCVLAGASHAAPGLIVADLPQSRAEESNFSQGGDYFLSVAPDLEGFLATAEPWEKLRMIARLYLHAGGAEGVRKLLVGEIIPAEQDPKLASLRYQLHEETLARIALQWGGVGVLDPGLGERSAGASLLAGLWFELYPEGEATATAAQLEQAYRETFLRVTETYGGAPMAPEMFDIHPRPGRGDLSDWRMAADQALFHGRLEAAEGDAVVLEGSSRQIFGAGAEGEYAQCFFRYVPLEGGAVQKEQHHWRRLLAHLQPALKENFTFSTALACWHEYQPHRGNPAAYAPVLLKSMEDAAALWVEPEFSYKPLSRMTGGEIDAFLEEAYPDDFDADERRLLRAALQTAQDLARLPEAGGDDEAMLRPLFRPLMDALRTSGSGTADAADDDALFATARREFENLTVRALMKNVLIGAGASRRDWLLPPDETPLLPAMDAMDDPGAGPALAVEDARRMQAAAFFSLWPATNVLPDEDFDRIAEQNPRCSDAIAAMRNLARWLAPREALERDLTTMNTELAEAIDQLQQALKPFAWHGGDDALVGRGISDAEVDDFLLECRLDSMGPVYQSIWKSAAEAFASEFPAGPRLSQAAAGLGGESLKLLLDKFRLENAWSPPVRSALINELLSPVPDLKMTLDPIGGYVGETDPNVACPVTFFGPSIGKAALGLDVPTGEVLWIGVPSFESIADPDVRLAYQGESDQAASVRPHLLYPVDANRQLSLEDRRRKAFAYFDELIEARMEAELDSSASQMPRTWAFEKEKFAASFFADYIEEWMEVRGVFAGAVSPDAGPVTPLNLTFNNPDLLRDALRTQMMTDYGVWLALKMRDDLEVARRRQWVAQRLLRDQGRSLAAVARGAYAPHEVYSRLAAWALGQRADQNLSARPRLDMQVTQLARAEALSVGDQSAIPGQFSLRLRTLARDTQHPKPWKFQFTLMSMTGARAATDGTDPLSMPLEAGPYTLLVAVSDADGHEFATDSFRFESIRSSGQEEFTPGAPGPEGLRTGELTLVVEKLLQGWNDMEVFPAENATVALRAIDGRGQTFEGRSGADGDVQFSDVPRGSYEAIAVPSPDDRRRGFRDTRQEFTLSAPIFDIQLGENVYSDDPRIRLERSDDTSATEVEWTTDAGVTTRQDDGVSSAPPAPSTTATSGPEPAPWDAWTAERGTVRIIETVPPVLEPTPEPTPQATPTPTPTPTPGSAVSPVVIPDISIGEVMPTPAMILDQARSLRGNYDVEFAPNEPESSLTPTPASVEESTPVATPSPTPSPTPTPTPTPTATPTPTPTPSPTPTATPSPTPTPTPAPTATPSPTPSPTPAPTADDEETESARAETAPEIRPMDDKQEASNLSPLEDESIRKAELNVLIPLPLADYEGHQAYANFLFDFDSGDVTGDFESAPNQTISTADGPRGLQLKGSLSGDIQSDGRFRVKMQDGRRILLNAAGEAQEEGDLEIPDSAVLEGSMNETMRVEFDAIQGQFLAYPG